MFWSQIMKFLLCLQNDWTWFFLIKFCHSFFYFFSKIGINFFIQEGKKKKIYIYIYIELKEIYFHLYKKLELITEFTTYLKFNCTHNYSYGVMIRYHLPKRRNNINNPIDLCSVCKLVPPWDCKNHNGLHKYATSNWI